MATFTTISKTPRSWPAPDDTVEEFFLKIDDTYFFLVDNEDRLRIQGGRNETPWSNLTRRPVTY